MTTVSVAETAESTELHGFWTRSRKTGLALTIIGLAVAGGLGLGALSWSSVATFRFEATLDIQWDSPARILVILLGVVAVGCGVALLTGREQHRFAKLGISGAVSFSLGLLVWAVAETGRALPLEYTLAATMVSALPLIFGSLAGVLCERSGVINVGIEGQLLAGAFASALVASVASNVWMGIIGAALAGAVVTLLLATLAVRFFVDQVVLGVILNLLVLGLTGVIYDRFMSENSEALNEPPAAPKWEIPLLSDIPVLGPAIFRQNILVYLAIGLSVLIYFLLFRSRWGLRTRSVGEHPAAADTVGIRVNALRFRNVAMAGLIAGIGGAALTLDTGLGFQKNMTVGAGFIALAVLIVGRWNPLGALAGALLFGFADELKRFLSGSGFVVPSEFIAMLPYIVTIVVVAGLMGKVRAPASNGKPYMKS